MTQTDMLFILNPEPFSETGAAGACLAFGLPAASYPKFPGFKEPTTSRAAALAVKDDADTLRAAVMAELRVHPGTADEIAERLNRDRLSVRPRLSELRAQGKIEATGERRANASGHAAHVWRASV